MNALGAVSIDTSYDYYYYYYNVEGLVAITASTVTTINTTIITTTITTSCYYYYYYYNAELHVRSFAELLTWQFLISFQVGIMAEIIPISKSMLGEFL